MKDNKKIIIAMLTVVLTILAVSFLIYKYWETSFPYGQYIDMSTIVWQLVAFVFLDIIVVIINYFSWIKAILINGNATTYPLKLLIKDVLLLF